LKVTFLSKGKEKKGEGGLRQGLPYPRLHNKKERDKVNSRFCRGKAGKKGKEGGERKIKASSSFAQRGKRGGKRKLFFRVLELQKRPKREKRGGKNKQITVWRNRKNRARWRGQRRGGEEDKKGGARSCCFPIREVVFFLYPLKAVFWAVGQAEGEGVASRILRRISGKKKGGPCNTISVSPDQQGSWVPGGGEGKGEKKEKGDKGPLVVAMATRLPTKRTGGRERKGTAQKFSSYPPARIADG